MSKIVIDPEICNGTPTIQGTRITAQTVLEFLSAGDSIEEVLEEYPSLSREDVLACIFDSEICGGKTITRCSRKYGPRSNHCCLLTS